jgi:hypothetical protein
MEIARQYFSCRAKSRNARVCGIGLSVSHGGHKVMLPGWQRDARIQVCPLDTTMIAAEMNISQIPIGHPDVLSGVARFVGRHSLVFCDD